MSPPTRFPAESPEYRTARDALLKAELELRDRVEQVAALRRSLPLGGVVPTDYVFDEGAGDLSDASGTHVTRLSQSFPPGRSTLVLYNFMYGPAMETPCPMCTSFLDGLNANAPHLAQRIGVAVVAKSPLERIRAFALGRGWRNLRLLSSATNSYNRDYHGETADGDQNPMLNVFVRREGRTHHFFGTEMFFARSAAGQDPRHIDMMWPLWNVLDLTPEGRGSDWYPQLEYGSPSPDATIPVAALKLT